MSDNKECPECGCTPMGEGCYHICPNSTHYYSAEQEREDDRWSAVNRDHITEAYMEHCPKHGPYAGDCGGCEAEYLASQEDDEVVCAIPDPEPIRPIESVFTDNSDDIPF